MPPLTLMSPSQVEGILTSLEREGKIPHNWRWTWTEAHKVRIAHSVYDSPEMLKWSGRAEEWRNLGADVGGPLAGGAQWWALRETHPRPAQPLWMQQRTALEQPAAEAPWPIQTLGATTGWVATETGLRVGTTAPKVLKRAQLGQQPYILPVDRPPVTSWLHAPGTPPERGAEVMTAFMHGLPPGAGAVSPAFPELSERYIRHIPVTAGTEVTAMARPGAWAKRGGALELLRTTTGITREPVSDWERVQLTGRPELVPYRGGEAYRFELERFTPAQAGTISQKAMQVKAFMGTGYDPQKMFPGLGIEQILPWPKEPRGFMAGMLGTQYGRGWFQQYLMGMEEKQPGILREQYGIPYQLGFGKPSIPAEGMEWGQKYDPLLVQAGQQFIAEHTTTRRYPLTVHESLLGTRVGGMWKEKLGPYWESMPKGMEPEPLGGGRYQIWQEQAVLAGPFLSQYRREFEGRPFVSREELQHLAMTDRPFAEQLWREGAETRSPYMETYRAIAATREGGFQGAIPMARLFQEKGGLIQERAEQLQIQELGWRPEGQRVPGQYLARAMEQIEPGPVSVPYGKRQLVLPGAGALARFGAPGPLGEEVTPVMTSWHRLVEQAAMQFAPGGVQIGDPRAYQRAGMETFRELHRLASGAGFRREATGTHPRAAWEGPILAHTGLAPKESVWGDIALQEAFGARTEEELGLLKQQIQAGNLERGPVMEMWRRPLSDIFGQMGLSAGMMTEEMARERGMDVAGLGRGIMISPMAQFAGRGDMDADRLIAVVRSQLKQVQGKPVFGPVAGLLERGLGTVEKLAESLRLHSPEETPEGSPLAQVWGSTAKWNEARAWAQEVQSMGRMPQVMEFFAGAEGPEVPWERVAQGVQAGLTAKEMMGRTYNRLMRELRPQMMGSPAAQQFYRQMTASPYQSTVDITALSEGARKYLEMQESLSMTPKGGSFWLGRTFSPYKLSEKSGRYEPEYVPMKSWGDIGRHLIGAISEFKEMPLEARAYGIGGEQFHGQVLEALKAGAQPGEIMQLMGATEEEAMLHGGPLIQSPLRRLYSKMGEGEQTYTTRAGEERTVYTEWGGATPQARGLRAMGQKVRTMLQFFSRREMMTPYQVQKAVSGGMPEAPGTDWLMGEIAREMGLPEEQAAQMVQPTAPAQEQLSAYEIQKAKDQPTVDIMNGMWEQEIRQKTAAQATSASQQYYSTRQAAEILGTTPSTVRARIQRGEIAAQKVGGRYQIPASAVTPTATAEMIRPEFEERLQAAITGSGGGGAPPPTAPPVAEPLPEWRGMQGWQEQVRITRGPGGISTTQLWQEPIAASGRDVKALGRIEAGAAQYGGHIYEATDALAKKFQELNRVVEEGLPLKKEEVKQIKDTIKGFTEARQLAEEWERQAKRTYTMTGTEEFEEQRRRVQRIMDPMMGAVEQGRVQQRVMEMQMAGVPTAPGGGPPPTGIGGRISGWLAGQAPSGGQGRGFWSGMGALGWGLMNMQRVWRYTGGQVGQWMGQYAGYELAAQQAGFALGQDGGALTGAPADILTYQAQMQNLQTGMGRAGWQNWGWMYGALGAQTTESTVAGRGLTMAMGAAAPYGMLRGASWIAGSMGQPAAAGAFGLGATAAGVAGAALGGVWAGGEVARALGADVEPGLGGTLGELWRFGREAAWLGMRGLGSEGETQEQQLNLLRYMFPEDFAEERRGQRRQEFMAQRGPRTIEETARFYGGEGGPLATMPEQQIVQMLGVLGGLTGTGLQYWQPGGAGEGIIGRLGGQAQLMGYQGPAQYGSAMLQLTERMGAMPGSQEMLRLLQQFSQVSNQTQFYQLQAAAPVMGQMMEMFGQVPGGELGFAQTYSEQMTAPERRRMGQLLGGNRLLWSDIGRQLGRPELITMEEGGLPIYATEMRGVSGAMTTQERGYRDWQAQQQWEQMQTTQAYTRGMWGLEDRQRALQYQQADWGYGFQQQQFDVSGRQWYERYQLGGQQWLQSWQLGQQMFETRVGYQAEDLAQQQERAATQYQWRMEDWAYGENVAQLQYGWKMEDLSEGIRFATGREKWDLMKQQERTTILESMRREHAEEEKAQMEEQYQWEEEEFEEAKQRNEELIALQREQFEMQKQHWEEEREMVLRHFEEDRQMQAEQMEKQREFYLQGRELDEERIQRQREHWELQQEWAEEAWKMAQEYNKEMDGLQDQYKDLQRQQEEVIANFQRMMTYTEELSGAFSDWFNQAQQQTQQYQSSVVSWPGGHQLGGYIEQDEFSKLHGGEYVVPRSGELVVRGEDSKSIALFEQMIALLGRIATASEHGEQSMVIVQTPDAQRAREHALDLGDQAYALWPS